MSTKIADDVESIAQRLKELEAETLARVTAPDPVEEKPQPIESVYGYGGIDYAAGPILMGEQIYYRHDGKVYSTPAYGCAMKSTAHPAWPYTGTAHEWRGFVLGGPSSINRKLGE